MNKKIISENSLLTFLSLFFILIPIFFMGLFSYVNRTYLNFTEEEKWKKYYSYFPQIIANHLIAIIFIFAIISGILAIIVGYNKPSTIQKILITIIILLDIFVSLGNLMSMM